MLLDRKFYIVFLYFGNFYQLFFFWNNLPIEIYLSPGERLFGLILLINLFSFHLQTCMVNTFNSSNSFLECSVIVLNMLLNNDQRSNFEKMVSIYIKLIFYISFLLTVYFIVKLAVLDTANVK